MRILCVLAITLICSCVPASAEIIPGSQFVSGNWTGSAYTFNENGQFSHCAVSASYNSGDVLFFSVNTQGSVSVAVQSPSLVGIPSGQAIPVSLFVDRRAPFYGVANVFAEGFAALEIREFDRAMTAFKKGYTLVVEGAGRKGVYDLKGTFRALEAARQCAIKFYKYRGAPSTQQLVADKTELFQAASTIITELGIKNFRFLNQQELEKRGLKNSVSWEAPDVGITGTILLLPRDGLDDLRISDPQDTQFLATTCLGDYATSARTIGLDDAAGEARELRFVCKSGDTETEIYLSKFFSGPNIVYNILSFDVGPELGEQPVRQKQSQTATLKAASFLVEQ